MRHHTKRNPGSFYAGRAGAAIMLCALLAACTAHREKSVKGWMVSDPTARHPILVGTAPVALDLPVASGAYGLSRTQKHEVRVFLRDFKEQNEGPITVSAPSGGPNEIAVMHVLGDVRREFNRAGISRNDVQFDAYTGTGTAMSPIKIAYSTYTARGPECGDWTDNLARDPKNIPYRNLGCAAQRNLAAMVANPRDLMVPRTTTPRDSQRRDVVMDKYVGGETTVSKKADEEKAKVSEVSGGGDN